MFIFVFITYCITKGFIDFMAWKKIEKYNVFCQCYVISLLKQFYFIRLCITEPVR